MDVSSIGRVLGNRALVTLMLGHFTNDAFGGVLTILLPNVKDRFDLSNGAIGLVVLAYTAASSLTQPIFGHLSDEHPRRWFAPLTLLWGSSFVAAYGFAPNFAVFLLLAALAGVGSGAYHPLGAANAAAVTDERHKNLAMSLYTVGGTSGYALGPLIGAGLLWMFGRQGTAVLVVPGALAAFLLSRQMRHVERARRVSEQERGGVAGNVPRPQWGALSRVIGVVMLRSWVFLSVLQFVPIWYDDLGYERDFYGPLVTTIILAGVVGTLLGGALADRIGPRRIVVASLLASVVPLLLFAGFPGTWAFAFGFFFGATSDASLSVTLVAAQRLLPGRIGVASGVILGLGFVTGGIGVPITGALADAIGIRLALTSLGSLCVASALLALTVPAAALRMTDPSEVPEADPDLSLGDVPVERQVATAARG